MCIRDRYKKLVAINLPNSRLLAINIVAQKLPENNNPIPLTEKNAPQEATKIALSPNNAVNKLTYYLHQQLGYFLVGVFGPTSR